MEETVKLKDLFKPSFALTGIANRYAPLYREEEEERWSKNKKEASFANVLNQEYEASFANSPPSQATH